MDYQEGTSDAMMAASLRLYDEAVGDWESLSARLRWLVAGIGAFLAAFVSAYVKCVSEKEAAAVVGNPLTVCFLSVGLLYETIAAGVALAGLHLVRVRAPNPCRLVRKQYSCGSLAAYRTRVALEYGASTLGHRGARKMRTWCYTVALAVATIGGVPVVLGLLVAMAH